MPHLVDDGHLFSGRAQKESRHECRLSTLESARHKGGRDEGLYCDVVNRTDPLRRGERVPVRLRLFGIQQSIRFHDYLAGRRIMVRARVAGLG
jgi:hypothetical protein